MRNDIGHDIIKKNMNEAVKQAQIISPGFKEDHIHQFRLAIKMLRAWLRLLAHTSDNKKITLPARLLRLYHIAGEMRETQLELTFLTGKGLPVAKYLEHLIHLLHSKQQEWEKYYDEKILKKARKKLASIDLPVVETADVKAFIRHKKKRIYKLKTQPVIADGCLHEIRKQVKDILYVRDIVRHEYDIKIKMHAKKYKEAEELIGDYNDQNLMVRRMIAQQPAGEASKGFVDFCNESRTALALRKRDILAHGLLRG